MRSGRRSGKTESAGSGGVASTIPSPMPTAPDADFRRVPAAAGPGHGTAIEDGPCGESGVPWPSWPSGERCGRATPPLYSRGHASGASGRGARTGRRVRFRCCARSPAGLHLVPVPSTAAAGTRVFRARTRPSGLNPKGSERLSGSHRPLWVCTWRWRCGTVVFPEFPIRASGSPHGSGRLRLLATFRSGGARGRRSGPSGARRRSRFPSRPPDRSRGGGLGYWLSSIVRASALASLPGRIVHA